MIVSHVYDGSKLQIKVFHNGKYDLNVLARNGVEVAPIEGKAGWLMSNALRDRLAADGRNAPRYRLDGSCGKIRLRAEAAATRW